MSLALTNHLQAAKDEIQSFLRRIGGSSGLPATLAVLHSQGDSLQRAVERIGAILAARSSPPASNPESYGSLPEYVETLEHLRTALLDAGRQLLAYRMELDSERIRLQNLRRWASSTQATEPNFF